MMNFKPFKDLKINTSYERPEYYELKISKLGSQIPELMTGICGHRHTEMVSIPVSALPTKVKCLVKGRYYGLETEVLSERGGGIDVRVEKKNKPGEYLTVRYFALRHLFESLMLIKDRSKYYDDEEVAKKNGTLVDDITGLTFITEWHENTLQEEVIFEREIDIDNKTFQTTKVIVDKYNLMNNAIDKDRMTEREIKEMVEERKKNPMPLKYKRFRYTSYLY